MVFNAQKQQFTKTTMHKNNKPRQKAGFYNLFLSGVNTHDLNHTGHVYAKSTVSCKKLSSFIRAH